MRDDSTGHAQSVGLRAETGRIVVDLVPAKPWSRRAGIVSRLAAVSCRGANVQPSREDAVRALKAAVPAD